MTIQTHLQLDPVFDHTCTILAIGSALVRAIQAVYDAIAEVCAASVESSTTIERANDVKQPEKQSLA